MKFLSRFYIDGFILAIVAVAILGSLFPVSGGGQTVLDWATKIAIGFLFLLYGARLSPAEALQDSSTGACTRWFAATFVLFPLIGLALRILVPTVITDEMYTASCTCVWCRPRCSRRSRSHRSRGATSRARS